MNAEKQTKFCDNCGELYGKKLHVGPSQWEKSRFCSSICKSRGRSTKNIRREEPEYRTLLKNYQRILLQNKSLREHAEVQQTVIEKYQTFFSGLK